MRTTLRIIAALSAGALLTLAACADDGNDHAYQRKVAEQKALEYRSSTTTTTAPTEAVDEASDETAVAAPAVTEPVVSTIPPTGVVVPVFALDNTFRPEVTEINVGDEVLWENRGENEHDVLYVDGDDWGVQVEDFQPGAVYSHIFTEPGEYRYYCSIHGTADVGMIGTIIVVA